MINGTTIRVDISGDFLRRFSRIELRVRTPRTPLFLSESYISRDLLSDFGNAGTTNMSNFSFAGFGICERDSSILWGSTSFRRNFTSLASLVKSSLEKKESSHPNKQTYADLILVRSPLNKRKLMSCLFSGLEELKISKSDKTGFFEFSRVPLQHFTQKPFASK